MFHKEWHTLLLVGGCLCVGVRSARVRVQNLESDSLKRYLASDLDRIRREGTLHIDFGFLRREATKPRSGCDANEMFRKMMIFNAQTRGLPKSVYDVSAAPALFDVACSPSHLAIAIQGSTAGRDSLFGKGMIGSGTKWPCPGSSKPPRVAVREQPGAIELFEWLQAACASIGEDVDLLREMVYEASKYIVWNQVFSDGNHRTALSLVVQGLPEDLQQAFFDEVIDYRKSSNDGKFRAEVYRLQDSVDGSGRNRGYYFMNEIPSSISGSWRNVHQVFATFGDPSWDATMATYRSLLDSWVVDHGGIVAAADHGAAADVDLSCGSGLPHCRHGLVCCDTAGMVTLQPGTHCKSGDCECRTKVKCQK